MDCSTCKLSSSEQREVPVAEADMDSLVVFGDAKPWYSCRAKDGPYAGREVGFEAITCSSYVQGTKPDEAQLNALDAKLAQYEARLAARRVRE